MTENEAKIPKVAIIGGDRGAGRILKAHIALLEELEAYRAIGTIEEFKAFKEKNIPMELVEHNFQDEVHHYLCPSCRSIVSCTQNYCEECGQALET